MKTSKEKEEIARLRQRLGMTQVEFAEAIGVIPNSVSRWERGERGVSPIALKLARELVAKQEKGART